MIEEERTMICIEIGILQGTVLSVEYKWVYSGPIMIGVIMEEAFYRGDNIRQELPTHTPLVNLEDHYTQLLAGLVLTSTFHVCIWKSIVREEK